MTSDHCGHPMTSTLEQNRTNAVAFYDLMFNQCKPREAIERYAGATYTQHNPHVVEHWDVLQVVPAESAHSNGVF